MFFFFSPHLFLSPWVILKVKVLVNQSCLTLCDPMDYSPPSRILCPWDSPGKNTGVHCHSLLQGIFPTQGLNLGLPHWRQILYHLSHQGGWDVFEWGTLTYFIKVLMMEALVFYRLQYLNMEQSHVEQGRATCGEGWKLGWNLGRMRSSSALFHSELCDFELSPCFMISNMFFCSSSL